MNPAHIHLMINHLPVVGMLFATILFLVSLWRPGRELQRVALWGLLLVALAAIPVYLTGEPAEEIVEHLPGVSHDAIEEHEEFALVALIGMEVLGALALIGLLSLRRAERLSKLLAGTIAVASLAVVGMMTYTANLGGEIHHPEIRNTGSATQGEAGEGEDTDGKGRGGKD